MPISPPPGLTGPSEPQSEEDRRQAKWRAVIDEQIAQAQERGDFDNLKGKGKPLDLTGNPHAGDWEMAYKALANAGFAPDWIERDKEIRALLDEAAAMLERHVGWHNEAVGALAGLPAAERARRRTLILNARHNLVERYRARVADINARITNFNLIVPQPQFQRFKVRVEEELAAFDARLAPVPPG